jgi:hypothetical protein
VPPGYGGTQPGPDAAAAAIDPTVVADAATVDGASLRPSGITVFNDPTIPAASSAVPSEATDPLRDLAEAVIKAAEESIAAVAALWSNPPLSAVARAADGSTEPSAGVGLIQGSLSWYTAAVAVLAVLIAGGRMAWSRRGEPLADLLRGLATLVLVAGAGVTGVTLFVAAGDAFSVWVLGQVTDDVERGFVELLGLPETPDMQPVLAILLGSAAIIGATLQVVLLMARGAVLVVLTGVLPLTASAAGTTTGRAVFTRTLTWIVAFTLYQPVAALIYASAFLLVPDPGRSPVVAALVGTTFLGLAIAALPALLRLLQPVVSAATSGGRQPVVGTTLPTGARAVAPVTLARGAAVRPGAVAVATRLPAGGSPGARTAPRAVTAAQAPLRVTSLPERRLPRQPEAQRALLPGAVASAEIPELPRPRTSREDTGP